MPRLIFFTGEIKYGTLTDPKIFSAETFLPNINYLANFGPLNH